MQAKLPRELAELVDDGRLLPGPEPFIEQQEGFGSDELSDRSRAFPPHVADVLYTARFHANLSHPCWQERDGILVQAELSAEAVELVVFADAGDARRLEEVVRSVVRAEVSTGVAVLHLAVGPADSVAALTSRAEQRTHDAVRDFLQPLGTFRREESGDLMDASELPFVVAIAVAPADRDAAVEAGAGLLGRSPGQAPYASDEGGWQVLVWPDAAVVAAARDDESGYRLAKRTPNVASSVVLDAFLLRFAQRQTLEMLARRAASGGRVGGPALAHLHELAIRLRARVWWPHASLERFVEEPARALSEAWVLPELARDVFDEVGALAEQARIAADERIARLLFFLTVASVAVAVAALAVQIVDSGHSAAAAVAAVIPAAGAAAAGWAVYGRLFRA